MPRHKKNKSSYFLSSTAFDSPLLSLPWPAAGASSQQPWRTEGSEGGVKFFSHMIWLDLSHSFTMNGHDLKLQAYCMGFPSKYLFEGQNPYRHGGNFLVYFYCRKRIDHILILRRFYKLHTIYIYIYSSRLDCDYGSFLISQLIQQKKKKKTLKFTLIYIYIYVPFPQDDTSFSEERVGSNAFLVEWSSRGECWVYLQLFIWGFFPYYYTSNLLSPVGN